MEIQYWKFTSGLRCATNNDGDGGHDGGNLQWSRGNERKGEKVARRKGFRQVQGEKQDLGFLI